MPQELQIGGAKSADGKAGGFAMRIGYFRSEGSQAEIDRAIAALESAGSDRVMFDSTPRSRPESGAAFLAFLARLNPGDTLVVTDLGQVAQTTELLVERLADLIRPESGAPG